MLVLGLVEVGVLLPPNFENRPPPCVKVVLVLRCISAAAQGYRKAKKTAHHTPRQGHGSTFLSGL